LVGRAFSPFRKSKFKITISIQNKNIMASRIIDSTYIRFIKF
jgi:hypothetical protein